jgi:hypothetical protein
MENLPFRRASTRSSIFIFKNSVSSSKKSQGFTITEINWFMPFKEIIGVYSKNHVKPINTHCGQNAELFAEC